jgi:MerR family transcriptional regulator, copper efflux regulator
MSGLRISELADSAGVNLQAIRYYERRGLLPAPPRTAGNYRIYPQDAVRRLKFIKQAQNLGFTLKEIGELLELRATPRTRCGDVRTRAALKVREIDEKVKALESMRKGLRKLMAECSGSGPATECPILDALASQHEEVIDAAR